MNRRILGVVAALLLAGLGTAAVLGYARSADERALAGQAARTVLVASGDIPAGTALQRVRDTVASVRMPADSLPPDALGSLAPELDGLVTSAPIRAGELIRRPQFVPRSRQTGDGLAVPPGMLAVTVELGQPRRVAGYLKPGSRVVVFFAGKLLYAKGEKAGQPIGAATATKTLLADVEVLATGPARAGSDEKLVAADDAALVTLAVDQRAAEKLIQAGDGLYLALQGDDAQPDPKSPGVTSFTLFR